MTALPTPTPPAGSGISLPPDAPIGAATGADGQSWAEVISALSPEWMIALGAVGVAGLVLWGCGRRILRPALVLCGCAIGAATGYVVGAAVPLPVPAWTLPLGGAAVMGIFAWILYRPAMGVLLALLLGSAFPLGVLAWAEFRGVPTFDGQAASTADSNVVRGDSSHDALIEELKDTFELLQDANEALDDARGNAGDAGDTRLGDPIDNAARISEAGGAVSRLRDRLEAATAELRAAAAERWMAAPPGVRRSIVLSALSGVALGLLIGLSFPAVSASLVTALAGSAMMLGATYAAILRLGERIPDWMPDSSAVWLGAWIAATGFGLAVQWTFREKEADDAE